MARKRSTAATRSSTSIEGEAILRIGAREHHAPAGTLVTIPAGAATTSSNPGSAPLFFLTVYAPPEY